MVGSDAEADKRWTSSTSFASQAPLEFTFWVRNPHKDVADGKIPVFMVPTVSVYCLKRAAVSCFLFISNV